MYIKSVDIVNFLSIREARVEFSSSGLTLLDGWNFDSDSANGAGKTSVFNAITFALWDKLPRKITKSEIVRAGCKKLSVKVHLSIDGEDVVVERCRPNKLYITIDGSQRPISQEELESKIGVSYEQFLLCGYNAQNNGRNFITLNDTEKKNFLLDILQLSKFNGIKSTLDGHINKIKLQLSEVEKKHIQCKSKISVYEEQCLNTGKLDAQIEDVSSKLEDLIRKLSVDTKAIEQEKENLSAQQQDIEDKLSNIDKLILLDKELTLQAKGLEAQKLSAPDKAKLHCPKCNEALYVGREGAVSYEAHVAHVERHNKEVDDKISSIKKKLSAIPKSIHHHKDKLLSEKRRVEAQLKENTARSINLVKQRGEIDKLKQQLDNLNKLKSNNDLILKKVEELRQDVKKLDQQKSSLLNLNNVYEAAQSIVLPTGAPAYILDTIIQTFNNYVSSYVAQIWPGANYQIRSFKVTKAGDVRSKIDDYLVIDGVERSIGSLSGGEYRCLQLAVDLAIADTAAKLGNISINPIIFDEPFEGLDATNRERIITLIQQKANDYNVWVIDHMSESKALFDNIVRVEKRGGISQLMI